MKNSLKVERAKKDLTQEDLAKLIGVSRQTINAVEKGRYVPSTVLALKMSKLFGIPVNDFFTLEENEWGWGLYFKSGSIEERYSFILPQHFYWTI